MPKENPSPKSKKSTHESLDVQKLVQSGEVTLRLDQLKDLSGDQRKKMMETLFEAADNEKQQQIAALRASVAQMLQGKNPFELFGDEAILFSFAEMRNLLDDLEEMGVDVQEMEKKALSKFLPSARKLLVKGAHIKMDLPGGSLRAFIIDEPTIDDSGMLQCSVTEASLNDSGEPRADVKTDGVKPIRISLTTHPVHSLLVFKQYGHE